MIRAVDTLQFVVRLRWIYHIFFAIFLFQISDFCSMVRLFLSHSLDLFSLEWIPSVSLSSSCSLSAAFGIILSSLLFAVQYAFGQQRGWLCKKVSTYESRIHHLWVHIHSTAGVKVARSHFIQSKSSNFTPLSFSVGRWIVISMTTGYQAAASCICLERQHGRSWGFCPS